MPDASSIKLVACCSNPDPDNECGKAREDARRGVILSRAAELTSYPVSFLPYYKEWHNWSKPLGYHEFLQSDDCPGDDTLIVFLDSYDVIPVITENFEKRVLDVFNQYPGDILIGGYSNTWIAIKKIRERARRSPCVLNASSRSSVRGGVNTGVILAKPSFARVLYAKMNSVIEEVKEVLEDTGFDADAACERLESIPELAHYATCVRAASRFKHTLHDERLFSWTLAHHGNELSQHIKIGWLDYENKLVKHMRSSSHVAKYMNKEVCFTHYNGVRYKLHKLRKAYSIFKKQYQELKSTQ